MVSGRLLRVQAVHVLLLTLGLAGLTEMLSGVQDSPAAFDSASGWITYVDVAPAVVILNEAATSDLVSAALPHSVALAISDSDTVWGDVVEVAYLGATPSGGGRVSARMVPTPDSLGGVEAAWSADLELELKWEPSNLTAVVLNSVVNGNGTAEGGAVAHYLRTPDLILAREPTDDIKLGGGSATTQLTIRPLFGSFGAALLLLPPKSEVYGQAEGRVRDRLNAAAPASELEIELPLSFLNWLGSTYYQDNRSPVEGLGSVQGVEVFGYGVTESEGLVLRIDLETSSGGTAILDLIWTGEDLRVSDARVVEIKCPEKINPQRCAVESLQTRLASQLLLRRLNGRPLKPSRRQEFSFSGDTRSRSVWATFDGAALTNVGLRLVGDLTVPFLPEVEQ